MRLRKFESLVDEKGLDDYGVATGTFETSTLIKGRIYEQADESRYDKVPYRRKPFFVDDNGCSRDIALMLTTNKVKEVFD